MTGPATGRPQPRTPASRCDVDHDLAYPAGPTAAWNLVSRSRRAHQLRHAGWDAVRTAAGTTWTSPTGVIVRVPAVRRAAPGVDRDPDLPPTLPDPDELHAVDTDLHTPVSEHHLVRPDADEPPPF